MTATMTDPAGGRCLPPLGNPVADALEAHQVLVRLLKAWTDWQMEQGRDGEHKLMLLALIRDAIERRRPGGDWSEISNKVMPSADDIYDLLDRSKFYDYETLVGSLRKPPEEAAIYLVSLLETDYAKAYIAALDYADRLEFANEIATGLVQTENGLLYLGKSLYEPVAAGAPLPLFHPDSLLKVSVDFYSKNFPWMRRAGKVYVDVYLKLVKALVKDSTKAQLLIDVTANMINRYMPGVFTNPDGLTREDLSRGVAEAKRRYGAEAGQLGRLFGAQVPALFGIAIEVINIYVLVSKMRDVHGWDAVRLARAVASLASAVSSAQDVFGATGWLKIAGRTVGVTFHIFTGIIDVVVAVRGASQGWYKKDYSLVVGHIIQGVGLAAAATISVWTTLVAVTAEAAAVTVFAPPVAAVVAVGVALVGAVIIVTTEDSNAELWFRNSFFGRSWSGVDPDEDPSSDYFLWKMPDGTPHFPRQVSRFLTILQPVKLEFDPISYQVRGPTGEDLHREEYGVLLKASANSGLEGQRLFIKQIETYYPPDGSGMRYRVRPIVEVRFDDFYAFGSDRRYLLRYGTLTGGVAHEGDFSNWKFEVDVVPVDQERLDWSNYHKIPRDDPNYLTPYLFVRRITGGG